jgi:hypothetical protein
VGGQLDFFLCLYKFSLMNEHLSIYLSEFISISISRTGFTVRLIVFAANKLADVVLL